MSRRKSRELALKILFQKEYQTSSLEEVLDHFINHLDHEEIYSEKHKGFALEILKGCQEKQQDIDQMIENVSKNWRIRRMSPVDLNIIRMAAFEILYRPDIPRNTSINEAVELAKLFGEKASPSFVNGVLDRIGDV